VSSCGVVESFEQGLVDISAAGLAFGVGVVALGLDGGACSMVVKDMVQDSQIVS